MKFFKWLDMHFEETLLVILLILIAFIELIQVIIRNIPWIPALTWAEEFCRFCWIWSVFLSLPYTIRNASMLRVSAVLDAVPEKAKRILNISADVITALVMLLLGVNSIGVVKSIAFSGEKSPAMLWPMWIVYSIILAGFLGGFLRAVQMTVLHLKGAED